MKDWVEKNLDPPGMERKNRGSLFSFISRVFAVVKDDAVKAHNAFFPYLCDSDKLREHGKALMIPELPFDTENGYRNRVATASFYLMRAGERAYIHEQLSAHFGNSYLLQEEFLQVTLNIAGINKEKHEWAYNFLDEILDPNIHFEILDRFFYIENLLIQDADKTIVYLNSNDELGCEVLYDGTHGYDGEINYSGYSGAQDNLIINVNQKPYLYDGAHKYDGSILYSNSWER